MRTEHSIDVDQPLELLVRDVPDFELLLEDLGLDYWFGWDTALSALCRRDNVDLDKAAQTIARARAAGNLTPVPASDQRQLPSVFNDLLRHHASETAPALHRLVIEYERMELRGNVFPRVHQHLTWLARDLDAHVTNLNAMRRGELDIRSHPSMAGDLTLAYTDIAFHLQELQDLIRIVPQTEIAFRGAFRAFSRALHHYLRIGYNEALPRVVALSRRSPGDGQVEAGQGNH